MIHLPEQKALLDEFAHRVVAPHVAVEHLTSKFLNVLDVDQKPAIPGRSQITSL